MLIIGIYGGTLSLNGEGTLLDLFQLSQDHIFAAFNVKEGTQVVHRNPNVGSSGWLSMAIFKFV